MPDPDEPGRFWKASGLVDRSRVCLAVYGETLEPSDVSALVQCEPSKAWRRGVVRHGRSQPRGAWLLKVEGQAPIGPEELLDRLLARLPEDVAVWLQLGARYELQWRITMRIAEVSRGFVLSADMQQRLAPLKVPLLSTSSDRCGARCSGSGSVPSSGFTDAGGGEAGGVTGGTRRDSAADRAASGP